MDQSYLVYDCKLGSFDFNINKISKWKSTGIFNYFSNSRYFTSSNMNAVGETYLIYKMMVECTFI